MTRQILGDTLAAASLTGRPPGTIRRWASTGVLTSHGIDDHGRALYDLEEVQALAKGTPRSPCLVGKCDRPSLVDAPVALCHRHASDVYLYVADELHDPRVRPGAMRPDPPPSASYGKHDPIVYFVQTADLVKIGTTTGFRRRLMDLQPEKVLGTVPGGYLEEGRAHAAWKHYRVRGEWFRAEPDLLAWIASVITDATDPRDTPSPRRDTP